MFKIFLIFLFLGLEITIGSTEFEFDFLKLYEIEKLKQTNEFDGEFYRLTKEFNLKNLTLNYGETLRDDEEIFYEIIFRINVDFIDKIIAPIAINHNFNVIFYNFIQSNLVISIKNPKYQEVEEFKTPKEFFSTGKWHKFKISLSNEYIKVWLDCTLVGKEPNTIRDFISGLFSGTKTQSHSLFFGRSPYQREGNWVDLKDYKLVKQKQSDNETGYLCKDLSILNQNINSPLDLIKIFENEVPENVNKLIDLNNRHYYRFDKPLVRDIRIPSTFTEQENMKNFTFDIVLRHKGPIEGQMTLFQFKNFVEDDVQSININSGKVLTYIWIYSWSVQHARGVIKNINIYDGNWHRIQVKIIMSKRANMFGDEYDNKNIKFYLDCELLGEDDLGGPIPFKTEQVVGTFFKTNVAESFTEFDVLSMEMKDNYQETPCQKP